MVTSKQIVAQNAEAMKLKKEFSPFHSKTLNNDGDERTRKRKKVYCNNGSRYRQKQHMF
jgi:hypothetical protein